MRRGYRTQFQKKHHGSWYIQVAAIMRCQEAELVLEVIDIDLQVNGDDCGLHTIATAYELCSGNDPTGITRQHDQLWSHPQACLEKQTMKPFPKKSQVV